MAAPLANGQVVACELDNGLRQWIEIKNLASLAAFDVNTGDLTTNNSAAGPSLSRDGRYLAFTKLDAFPGPYRSSNIFLEDLQTKQATLISQGQGGAATNGNSFEGIISADGTCVAFWSAASNLVTGDVNGKTDLFIYSVERHKIERIPVGDSFDGTLFEDRGGIAVSGDCRYVAFTSKAPSLVPDQAPGAWGAFVYDRVLGTITRVSTDSDGRPLDQRVINSISISDDGRHIVFDGGTGGIIDRSAQDAPTDSSMGHQLPFSNSGKFVVSRSFGGTHESDFYSVDIAPRTKIETIPILAVTWGKVVEVQRLVPTGHSGNTGLGNLVTVRYDALGHDNVSTARYESFYVTYSLLQGGSAIPVNIGDFVTPGEVLGYIGDVGQPLHLHIQYGVLPTTLSNGDLVADSSFETNTTNIPVLFPDITSDGLLRPGFYSTKGLDLGAQVFDANSADQHNVFLYGSGNANATGDGYANILFGNSGDNVLLGLAGSDTITGGAGSDRLDGGPGADSMRGGSGNDSYYVKTASDQAIESPGEGTDTVYAAADYTLSPGSELECLRASAGTTGLSLTGNEFVNRIFGGDGNDRLDGKAGADTMKGGVGNDVYFADNVNDTAIEAIGGGLGTVRIASTMLFLPDQK